MRLIEQYNVENPDLGPKRPGIPVLLPAAFAMWAAAASSYLLLENVTNNVTALVCLSALMGACIFAVATAIKRRQKSLVIVACFLLLGFAIGSAASYAYKSTVEQLPLGSRSWTLTLTTDAQSSQYGSWAQADVISDEGYKAHVKAYLPKDEELFVGACLNVQSSLKRLNANSKESNYVSGIVATIDANDAQVIALPPLNQAIYDLRAEAIKLIGSYAAESAGIMQALVCGYRNTIRESGEYDLFKQCGLAHVVAVSGAHLAIVVAVFGWFLSLMRAPRFLVFAASGVFILAYLAFAGIPVSAIRAAIMVILSMSAGIVKRRNASLNSLAICIIAFLAFDPISCVSVSLFLSASSTLGILLFASLISSWFEKTPKLIQSAIAEPLALTLSSNIATLPFSVATFQQLSLIAPLANILATPLFTIGCVLGLISSVLACIIPQAASTLIAIGAAASLPLHWAVGALSSIPYACIALKANTPIMLALSLGMIIALWFFWPKIRLRTLLGVGFSGCGLLLTAIFLLGSLHSEEFVMLDVGQGDALLLRSKGSAILVDTGNQDSKLRNALAERGVFHLDAVAVTHPDDDHCGSLKSLFGYVEIDRFLCSKEMLKCDCSKCFELLETARTSVGENNIVGLSVGDTFKVGRFNSKVVWPYSFEDEGGNGDSLCLNVTIDCDSDGADDWSMLLTGDAESEQLEAMLQHKVVGDIDILKIGHHGSKVALSEESLSQLNPELALISVGASNRYGHPSNEVLSILESHGTSIYRTDENGSIRVAFTKERLTVE